MQIVIIINHVFIILCKLCSSLKLLNAVDSKCSNANINVVWFIIYTQTSRHCHSSLAESHAYKLIYTTQQQNTNIHRYKYKVNTYHIYTHKTTQLNSTYCTVGYFWGLNFCGLGSSDNFVGLYFRGIPTLIPFVI